MYAAEWPCCHDPLRFSLGSEDLSRTARDNPLQPPSPSLPPPPRPLPSGQSVVRAPFLDFANPLNGESATCLNPEPQSVAHAPFLDFANPLNGESATCLNPEPRLLPTYLFSLHSLIGPGK